MPNQRISELPESGPLRCDDIQFNNSYIESTGENSSDDWFLMTANPKISNNKISIPNFQKCVVTDAVALNTNQIISGSKIFKDKCYITKRANVHSIEDPFPESGFSGQTIVSSTGFFGELMAGSPSGSIETTGNNTVLVFDDAKFEGRLIIGGTIAFSGEFDNSSDFSCLNLEVDKDSQVLKSISSTGDFFISEDLTISGDTNISEHIDQANNIFSAQEISFNSDRSIKLLSESMQISSGANNYLNLSENYTSIINKININTENFVNNSNTTPSGTLHITGQGYCQNINALNNTTYNQLLGGDDESMAFKTYLRSGSSEFTIDLPKTFLSDPIISTDIQHVSGGFVVPYIISEINDNDFAVHATVMPSSTGKYSTNKKGFQRFKSLVPSGSTSHVISFPESHNIKPMISTTIEGQNQIVPYMISGVNTSNYTIFLGAESEEDYIIHTISTEYDQQRIS